MNNNNGLNGEVLGSVNTTNPIDNLQSEPIPETLETLNPNPVGEDNSVSNNMGNNINSNVLSGVNPPNDTGLVMDSSLNNPSPSQVVEPQVQPSPTPVEPAYTNMQNINPMPGFENTSTIGTTPPVSLEAEKKPKNKNKNNKTLFVVIIIIVLFGIGIGVYYVLKYTDLLNTSPQIVINTIDKEIDLGGNLSTSVADYATVSGTDITHCAVDVTNVDVKKVGDYSYEVTCGELRKKGKISVVDNKELEITLKKVSKVKGNTIEAKEFIENPVVGYTYEFVDKETVTGYLNGEAGTYKVAIKVTNGSKTKEVEGELIISAYAIRGYYTCTSNSQVLSQESASMTVSEKFALLDDGNNGFGNIATETYTFKYSDEMKYSDYLAKYNTDGKIVINNITGTATFDDTNMTITITNDRTKEDLISEYGEENIKNYTSIKNYFQTTLGYSCEYTQSNN